MQQIDLIHFDPNRKDCSLRVVAIWRHHDDSVMAEAVACQATALCPLSPQLLQHPS